MPLIDRDKFKFKQKLCSINTILPRKRLFCQTFHYQNDDKRQKIETIISGKQTRTLIGTHPPTHITVDGEIWVRGGGGFYTMKETKKDLQKRMSEPYVSYGKEQVIVKWTPRGYRTSKWYWYWNTSKTEW